MSHDPIVITSYARTPQGNLQGCFKTMAAWELGSYAISEAVSRSQLDKAQINEVIMGCVLPAGQGQAPARQAMLKAGLLETTGAVTVNKMCGSGMKAIMLSYDSILAGTNDIVIAGGMESMTQAPYLLLKARNGYRLGHDQIYDHLFLDGLENAYSPKLLMGCFGEIAAKHYGFNREMQDEYACESLMRAQYATQQGWFKDEIVPIKLETKANKEQIIDQDENLLVANVEKIKKLKPAFEKDGTITAANASCISDGASALVLMRESQAKSLGLEVKAFIRGHATYSHSPEWFTTTPAGAINKLLQKINWNKENIDLFEINEAFAVVTLIAMHDLNIQHDIVNVFGGACALGHPIGSSGSRITITLINALKKRNKKRGIASLCIGGGEATALAIELP